jgi:hypothetical protein
LKFDPAGYLAAMLHPVLLVVNRKNTFVFNKLAEALGGRRPSDALSEIDNPEQDNRVIKEEARS